MPMRSVPAFKSNVGKRREFFASEQKSWVWMLVALLIVLIPIEEQVTIFGFSLTKLSIIPLIAATLKIGAERFGMVWRQPVFLVSYAFILWAALNETLLHPHSDLEFVYRSLQMFAFAMLIAVALRTRIDRRRVLQTIAAVSSILAIYLVGNFYNSVDIGAAGFEAASQIRSAAFQEMALEENLNKLGWTVAMGSIVAFAGLLSSRHKWQKVAWGAVYVLCFVGATIPLSRGAALAVVIASAFMMGKMLLKGRQLAIVIVALAVFTAAAWLVPGAMVSRLTSSTDNEKNVEARKQLYIAAYESFPEYWIVGVGAGNYWESWGRQHGFGRVSSGWVEVLRPHNSFLAAWVYYGLPGVSLLGLICFLAGRQYKRARGDSTEKLAVLGLLIIAILWLGATHVLYNKEFGLILGLLVSQTIRRRVVSVRRRRLVRAEFAVDSV